MRLWKLAGLAGLAGVAAASIVAVRRRNDRPWQEVEPDELRRRLHERLAAAGD